MLKFMRFGSLLFSLYCLLPIEVYAQEIKKDSIALSMDSLKIKGDRIFMSSDMSGVCTDIKEIETDQLSDDTIPVYMGMNLKLQRPFYLPPYYINPSPMFYGDYHASGQIFSHIYGSGLQTTLPGLGRINQAAFMFQYALNDHFDIRAGINAVKYNLPMSVGQSFGASGALIYHPNDRLRLTAFGTFTPSNRYGFNQNSYGATIGYDFTDRFGMEVGVRRYYDLQRGWQTIPIVAPYYRFNKFNLGIDVGGILFEVLRNVIINNRQSGSPVIAPPGK